MEKIIRGKAFVLGDNIDTDQIIPAKFLSYDPSNPEEKKYFGKYALSGLPEGKRGLPDGNTAFVTEGFTSDYKIIIAGKNFGCGSSREHAPLALMEAESSLIVAESFARIFFRNCINGGYLTPYDTPEKINDVISTGDDIEVNTDEDLLKNHTTGKEYKLNGLGDIKDIIDAGDIFTYAKKVGI